MGQNPEKIQVQKWETLVKYDQSVNQLWKMLNPLIKFLVKLFYKTNVSLMSWEIVSFKRFISISVKMKQFKIYKLHKLLEPRENGTIRPSGMVGKRTCRSWHGMPTYAWTPPQVSVGGLWCCPIHGRRQRIAWGERKQLNQLKKIYY